MAGLIVEPRVVDAGRGFAWWGEGFGTLRSSFWMWIGVFLVYVILSAVISAVPFVGTVGHSLLTPVFMGGLMIGCRALEQGQPLRMSHLFEGFQGAHFVPLMIIGALNIALVVGLMVLAGAGMLGTYSLQSLGSFADPLDAFRLPAAALGATGLLVGLLVLVLVSVFAMLNWFAPALVALRGVSAFEAMKLSFVACLRNWIPFLVYGLVVLIAGIALVMAIVGIALVFGAGAIAGGTIESGVGAFVGFFLVLMVFGLLFAVVVGPIAIGSVYAGFKDTLDDADATVTTPLYRE